LIREGVLLRTNTLIKELKEAGVGMER